METTERTNSIEQARNAAIRWMEAQGVTFGPYRKVEIGRMGVLSGHEVGVSAVNRPFWRIRLDYDPTKGPHFNAEVGQGAGRKKRAFAFPGDEQSIQKRSLGLRPR